MFGQCMIFVSLLFTKEYLSVHTHCTPKLTKVKIPLHNSCPKLEVTMQKCQGYCRSYTMPLLKPPYISRNCKCCKPTTVQHRNHVIACNNGVNRTVSIPTHVECKCRMCQPLPSRNF